MTYGDDFDAPYDDDPEYTTYHLSLWQSALDALHDDGYSSDDETGTTTNYTTEDFNAL